MRHVEVAADYDAFLFCQSAYVCTEIVFPFHAVVQSLQFVLGIGYIYAYKVEVGVFHCDDASFVVVFIDAHVIHY